MLWLRPGQLRAPVARLRAPAVTGVGDHAWSRKGSRGDDLVKTIFAALASGFTTFQLSALASRLPGEAVSSRTEPATGYL